MTEDCIHSLNQVSPPLRLQLLLLHQLKALIFCIQIPSSSTSNVANRNKKPNTSLRLVVCLLIFAPSDPLGVALND